MKRLRGTECCPRRGDTCVALASRKKDAGRHKRRPYMMVDAMNPHDLYRLTQTRRSFLGSAARGIGSVALASLINPSLSLGASSGGTGTGAFITPLHFAPRAKRVIHLYMAGGPSHLETLDYKPTLAKMAG